MTGQFGCSRKMRARVVELLLDLVAQAVARVHGHAELLQARLADLDELIELDGEADDALVRRLVELGRERDAEDDGLVGDLEPALREQRRERRLAGAADAAKHEVRLLEVARLLAVVALHRELDGLDAPEVLVGEREHAARRVDRLAVEERRELADERTDEVERLDLQLVARRRGCTREAPGSTTVKTTSAPSFAAFSRMGRAASFVRTRVCRRMWAPE